MHVALASRTRGRSVEFNPPSNQRRSCPPAQRPDSLRHSQQLVWREARGDRAALHATAREAAVPLCVREVLPRWNVGWVSRRLHVFKPARTSEARGRRVESVHEARRVGRARISF